MHKIAPHLLGLFSILILSFVILPGPVQAQNHIQSFRYGKIDWSNGIVEAEALGKPPKKAVNIAQARAMAKSEAINLARKNLVEVVSRIRIDSKAIIGNLIEQREIIGIKIKGFLKSAHVVDLSYNGDGSVKAKVSFELNKNFTDLVLPKSIRNIEPIKQSQTANGEVKEAYTGLVVDCRGLGIKSALAPKIIDEEGNVVFGPAYVSRDFAVKKGMAGYVKDIEAAKSSPRVADRPIIIKGIRSPKKAPSDIVISNSDAAKIRGTASNLEFLQKCRVIIVLE